MSDKKEQTKQKIIIELEHVRFVNAFIHSSVIAFCGIMFGSEYFSGLLAMKVIVIVTDMIMIFALILARIYFINKARSHIAEL